MHDQLVVNKVEAVRPGLVWVLNHQVPGVLVHLRELVDMLARVLAARDAEAEVKVEGLEVGVAEIMAFDHSEILLLKFILLKVVLKLSNNYFISRIFFIISGPRYVLNCFLK